AQRCRIFEATLTKSRGITLELFILPQRQETIGYRLCRITGHELIALGDTGERARKLNRRRILDQHRSLVEHDVDAVLASENLEAMHAERFGAGVELRDEVGVG